MGYIGFEMCEDDLTDKTYFEKAYREAVELGDRKWSAQG
jgi:N-acetylmuramoyl-L-alanine amidase